MLIKIWPGNLKNQLKRMNQKFYEENGKTLGKGNGWYQNVLWFTSEATWEMSSYPFFATRPTADLLLVFIFLCKNTF